MRAQEKCRLLTTVNHINARINRAARFHSTLKGLFTMKEAQSPLRLNKLLGRAFDKACSFAPYTNIQDFRP